MDFSALLVSSATALPGILAMVLGIAFLILIHEFGHWIVARALGFQTPVFAIGFGKRSWSLVLGTWFNTEFRISPILLGGYVSIPELQDETTAREALEGSGKTLENFKVFPVWKRIAVAVAGVTMNVIFTIVAIAGLLATIGQPSLNVDHTLIKEISPQVTIAKDAGLQSGDVFVSVDGQSVKTPQDLMQAFQGKKGVPVTVVVDRNGTPVTVQVTPDASGRIGVMLDVKATRTYSPMSIGDATSEAFSKTGSATVGMFKGIGMMLGLVAPPENLPAGATDVHGIVGIVQIGAQAFDQGIFDFVWILAMISLNLAIMNILPFPPLDGGYVLFFGIEGIVRKPVPIGIRNRIAMVFFFLLLGLMFYGLFNDVTKPINLP